LAEPAAPAAPVPAGGERLASLCRLILLLRLLTLLITVLYIPVRPEQATALLVGLLLATLGSVIPLWFWARLAGPLLAHPIWLAADLAVAALVLVVTGTDGPFVYYTVATVLLGGLLYGVRGGVIVGCGLLAVYAAVLYIELPLGGDLARSLLVVPALYPLAAVAGPAVRRLLDRELGLVAELAAAQRQQAAAHERARLAREMHDTVAKSLHGISLSAVGIAGQVRRDPERAADQAQQLSLAAREAAGEARSLIDGLRTASGEGPLGQVVCEHARAWGREHAIALQCVGEEVDVACTEGRYELLAILREALFNIAEHAQAGCVQVSLTLDGDRVRLRVADDGVGLPAGDTLEQIEPAGHFGLIGMAERADRAGGELTWSSAPGNGTAICVSVPRMPVAQDRVQGLELA